ncbi:inner membrane protein YrbG [mine drainage metagenome]|uniref:Inner membrane protein YrbG n=1 Tax=mine drainage metagenome TaxID=410659 RepID=A0A1J5QQQ2_9ZZZZ
MAFDKLVIALLSPLGTALAGLLAAGRLFVAGASGIATSLGVHPYVIGATLVSAGTSLPEWVTMLLARRRGDDDIGIGTLLGSNLFNGLAVVGLAASIHPIRTSLQEIGVAVGFGLLTLALMLPRGGALSRRRGVALLLAWAAFIAITAVAA